MLLRKIYGEENAELPKKRNAMNKFIAEILLNLIDKKKERFIIIQFVDSILSINCLEPFISYNIASPAKKS
jgi:hypothetical protein